MNKLFMKLPLRVRQFLVGASISIPIMGGSIVASSTVDSCSVEYVIQTDQAGNISVDKNNDTLKLRSK